MSEKKCITEEGKKLILATLLIGVPLVFIALTEGPMPRQLRNMAAAEEYAALKMEEISGMDEFRHISLSSYTGMDGALLVVGYLESSEDENRLKSIVYTQDLETNVRWAVHVVGEDNWPEYVEVLDASKTIRVLNKGTKEYVDHPL